MPVCGNAQMADTEKVRVMRKGFLKLLATQAPYPDQDTSAHSISLKNVQIELLSKVTNIAFVLGSH